MIGVRIWAYIILAGVLVTALGVGVRAVYKAGYNAATVKEQAAAIEAQNTALEKARVQWETTKATSQEQTKIQTQIVEVERVVERRIPTVVEKLVHDKPQCDDLGVDVLGVFNDAIRGGPDTNPPAPPAEPVSRVPTVGVGYRLQDRHPAKRTQRKYVASALMRSDAQRLS